MDEVILTVKRFKMSSVIFTPFPCSPPFCFSIAFEIISNPKGIPKILKKCLKEKIDDIDYPL